jgi:hypothetical protein
MIHQSPRPEVLIYSPDSGVLKLDFNILGSTALQSYEFSTSVNDAMGEFSLKFYPDDEKLANMGISIFDEIKIMDIVRIYETKNKDEYADFTGVVRQKKYVVQMTNNGPRRSIVVSGHSIAGLVSEFKISLDLQAMALTEQTAETKSLSIKLTSELLKENPLKIKTLVTKVWEHFLELSSQKKKLSNCDIAEYITRWMGEGIFEFDKSEFPYPLANVFNGENTENFFDIISGIVSSPIFEIFPQTKEGITKIIIRRAPFDDDTWKKLEPKQINPVFVKGFDVSQNDNDVYSVYYAYIDGYPIQMDKSIILGTVEAKGVPGVVVDAGKFGRYGYRPLYVSLHGYGYTSKHNEDSAEGIKDYSQSLMKWFCHNDEFYSGSITMETDISNPMPQPGERVAFLGGEFYVNAVRHTWNYEGSPETTLSVSRGGDYTEEGFKPMTDIAGRYREFVKTGAIWKL